MTRFPIRRLGAALLGATLVAGTLSACAPLLLGGAVVGGSLLVTDRRSSGAQLDDQAIELKAANRVAEVLRDRGRISITSYNRQVLLTGEVVNEADKAAAEQTVGRIDGVRSIVNELTVGPGPTLTARSNDAVISGKVKASFVDAADLHANAVKVVTERGVVYLMGRVTEREATRASEIARGVGGVTKVVRMFEIVTDRELTDQLPRSGRS
ncbi:MAG: BON domain-containing protein [Burkholderiaceae bacterium]